ncbi:MAG: hypothetical protein AMS27_04145 [Bacteroides sp. SM23_62_1]|nr:MAG: hypothetical protein AMS27_04145 [Bacteroides sp. SM23_62_1]
MNDTSKYLTKQVRDLFADPGEIVLVTHVNPDGDAIGTMLGFYWLLKKKGYPVNMIVPNEIPFFLEWLPGYHQIVISEINHDKATALIRNAELLICLDFNESDRLGDLEEEFLKAGATKILIDHHPDPGDFTDHIISFTALGSAAELVYYLAIELGMRELIDKTVAECLFTGIMTDTGCFSFSSSQPETYLVVADLLKTGIDKDRIYMQVYDNYSADRMRLLGYSLNDKMVVLPEYRTAYISLTEKELQKYNHVTGDTEGFVNILFSIKGIRLTALFIEKKDHIKISFRSRGDFHINKFSERHFNGGGHKNAAGGESNLSLEQTIDKFVKLLPGYAKELLSG